ncbi:MAG: PhnD/SsuA/transferrin family substrate-binding protein [Gallionella sp.]|nr:PhnD/SsuA/transferrin family substrate-binding protein [Gallionella sp.]MDD4945601.1 PhnD/SsuA/transferrin family substrate-binding protein [Gallionella sp.]MDD5612050.1 PhnD/SsuA/transferrin family substrate-binding protein [Gallionella sp.]
MKLLSLLRIFTLCWTLVSGMALAEPATLRLGITPAMAHGQYALLEEWRSYLQAKLGRPVEFIFRNSYQEHVDLMKLRKLDFSWLSAPAYLESRPYCKLLATPLFQGRPYERAYLIVSADDHTTHSLLDLKGKIFAYADPSSNTGYLVPLHQLQQAGMDSGTYFRKTFFTRDHQKIVAAVAIGLADGGALSGFFWEVLDQSRPDITRQTRIVSKSAEYGMPPLVARSTLNKQDFALMQKVLLNMSTDSEGIRLLERLKLNGFAKTSDRLYRNVFLMMKREGKL